LRASRSLFVRRLARSERAADLPECLSELARDDPDLVRLALSDLGQNLQILVGEQLGIRLALVDRLEDGIDCLRLAFGLQHHGLLLAFCAQDRALLLPLG
jgi:hypothetical protein